MADGNAAVDQSEANLSGRISALLSSSLITSSSQEPIDLVGDDESDDESKGNVEEKKALRPNKFLDFYCQ